MNNLTVLSDKDAEVINGGQISLTLSFPKYNYTSGSNINANNFNNVQSSLNSNYGSFNGFIFAPST
jgi:hypothetical protein